MTATNASGLVREALLQPAPPRVQPSGLAREALVLNIPAVNVSNVVRESLTTVNSPPFNIIVSASGLVRETLQSTILNVRASGLAREALVRNPPATVFASGVIREILIPGTVAITRVIGWKLGW